MGPTRVDPCRRCQQKPHPTPPTPLIRPGYIMQYAGSLIGRQLKAIGETNIFLTYGICDTNLFTLWKAVGELMALLWIPEISDLEQDLVSQPS
jgi:hypothetical protein